MRSRKIIIGVYKIFNKVTRKYYIGYSKDIYKRFNKHKNHLQHNKHINIHLQHSYNKYTLDAFEFIILHTFDNIEDAKNKELDYLLDLNIRSILYNMHYNNNGGDTITNHPDKNAVELRKHKNSIFAKTRIQEKNTFYGKTHTKEQKQTWSENKKGKTNFKKCNPVTINNINYKSLNEASKKLNISISTITKRIKSIDEFNNYKYTNEILNQIPISTKFSINNIIYNTLEEASKKLNLSSHYISNKLKSTHINDINWEILNLNKNKKEINGKKIMVNDIIYNSITETCNKLNINNRTLVKILNKEQIPISRKKRISIDNVIYTSLTDATRLLKMTLTTISSRLKSYNFKNYIYLPIEYYDVTKFKYIK